MHSEIASSYFLNSNRAFAFAECAINKSLGALYFKASFKALSAYSIALSNSFLEL